MSSHAAAIDRQTMAAALLRCGPWYCTDDDAALVNHAEREADNLDRIRMNHGIIAALDSGTVRIEAHHLELPDAESDRGTVARLCNGMWWRRQLRRLNSRRMEQAERIKGRVHDRAGIYVSSRGLEARRRQHVRNNRMLEAVDAVNQDGQEYTLAELSELGMANPENRRAELMLRIADTERVAIRRGDVGLFVTITCPSRYHAIWRGTKRHNPKWTSAANPDPRDAQAHLQKLWSRARAKLGRKRLGIYGVRVVEPHHDGCPHWHVLLWTEAQNAGAVLGLLRSYAIADSPDEIAADESVRFDVKMIDPNKGSAAGYVAKYIAKNINGQQFERPGVVGDHLDAYGHDLINAAPRIEAWSATWGIRQFQFFGLPSVTVWRELRRLRDASSMVDWVEERDPDTDAIMSASELRRAADDGRWADYLIEMGGPMTRRDDRPARPWSVDRMTGQGGELQTGRYGDPLEMTAGVVVRGFELLTRINRWTIKGRSSADDFDLEALTSGAAGDAWTRVNNCTRPLPPVEESPFDEWEWHATESFRRMHPPADPQTIADIQETAAAEARGYQEGVELAALERQTDREDESARRDLLHRGKAVVAGWLLDGTMTPNDMTMDQLEMLTT